MVTKIETRNTYELPELGYGYNELAPAISEEQLTLHHKGHHQAYVTKSNSILQKLVIARKEGNEVGIKNALKSLSFQVGGHILHSLYWKNLQPPGNSEPTKLCREVLEAEFGTMDRFREEFDQAAKSVEGSGWAAVSFCSMLQRPVLTQIEKHNSNLFPMFRILLTVDMWEHAYYVDYRNDKGSYLNAFWNCVDWETVEGRLKKVLL